MGSTEEIRTWAISVRSMMASKQLIDLDMFIGRALAVIGAQIHAGQHDLGHAGLLSSRTCSSTDSTGTERSGPRAFHTMQ